MAAGTDLLGDVVPSWESDLYAPPRAEPGRTVDLSAPSRFPAPVPPLRSLSSADGAVPLGFGGAGGGSSSSSSSAGAARALTGPGPTSLEGGPGTGEVLLSLNGFTPGNIMRQLAQRPVTDLLAENGKQVLNIPGCLVRAYSVAAKKYLRPWSEFGRINPARVVDRYRQASQRGEIQIHLQQNVLANVRTFCPNYAFIFLATLCMFVCTSPSLLLMLGITGGGWSHALRDDQFRSKPWTLQVGGVLVPLGANVKMAMMSLPTLFFLHFFMGPILWSAALYSGGLSLAHAALREKSDEDDEDPRFSSSTVRIQELP